MIRKPKIYFAHPFDTWKTKEEELIEKTLEARGYEVINPFKEEDHLNEKYGVDNYYENPTYEFADDIVDKDQKMVLDCDEYFGWFPKGIAMVGTPIELTWAYEDCKKITVVCYKPQPFLWIYSDVFYLGLENFFNDNKFYEREIEYLQ